MTDIKAMAAPDTSLTYTPKSGNATTTDITNLPYPLGTVVASKDSNGMEVRDMLVIVTDAVAVTAGMLLCFSTADDGFTVTPDRAGGTSDNEQPAGMANVACAVGKATWIQVYGPNRVALLTDGGVTNGESIIPHATTDGGADSSTAGTDTPFDSFGQALDDDTGTALPIGKCFLRCPRS